MAGVAFDRAVRSIEEFGLEGPLEHWRLGRWAVHEGVCRDGFDAKQNAFVQLFGATELDASLLLMPLVGFRPPDDERARGKVAAIERRLIRNGLVLAPHRRRATGCRRRRRFPCLDFLAGRLLRLARPSSGGAGAVRAPVDLAQRRRLLARNTIPFISASSATFRGLLASRLDQHRSQPRGPRRAGPSAGPPTRSAPPARKRPEKRRPA